MRIAWLCLLFLVVGTESLGQSSLLIETVSIPTPAAVEGDGAHFVLVSGERIVQVSNSPIPVGKDVSRIDGSGKFLVPGIFDSHVHVSSVPGLGFATEDRARSRPDLVDAFLSRQARSYLYFGVTQVLDPNPGASWERFESSARAPGYFRCEVITSPVTFPYVENPANGTPERYRFLVDESGSPGSESPAEVVERVADSGAVCVKLYFEDGYGDSTQWPLLSDETIGQVTAAARDQDLVVVAHANALDMYREALSHDIDVLAHGLWNWGHENSFTETPASITSVLTQVANRHIGFTPTLRTVAGLGELMDEQILENPQFKMVTPVELRDWYRGEEAQWFKAELLAADDLPPDLFRRIYREGVVGRGVRAMRYLHDLGHPLLLGSDTPGSPSYVNQPGLTTYSEMLLMAEGGIPPEAIFTAATINNARQYGLEADYGSVAVGKIANLLLLNDNPLKRVEAWGSIDHVILRGKAIRRDRILPKR